MAKKAVKKAKAKETPKRGRGRPSKEIELSVEMAIADLASVGCTQEEIGVLLGISAATLMRKYGEAYEKGLAGLKQSLRRKQAQLALSGNVTMLIWLGKNLLGQKDRSELTGKDGASLVPGSIVFTMPKNGRDRPAAAPPVRGPAKTPPPEEVSSPPAEIPAPIAPVRKEIPPFAPPLTPEQIAGTPEPDVPRPLYRGTGRDPRIVDNVRNIRPMTDAGASTGKR